MGKTRRLMLGDCLVRLKELPDNSVDSVVTDPPYELGFMGKSWDSTGIAYNVDMWKEVYRVLKPGGHLLSFGGTRTYHRMAAAIEDAGFEIRDMIEWVYGTGFPKSVNISKEIDRQLGAQRDKIKITDPGQLRNQKSISGGEGIDGGDRPWLVKAREQGYHETDSNTPVSEEAAQWDGWGTALKPAQEPICLARKPLSEKTIAANVLKWGTGALNINASRIETQDNLNGGTYSGGKRKPMPGDNRSATAAGRYGEDGRLSSEDFKQPEGRWPANLIHDGSEEVLEAFPVAPGQQGDLKEGSASYSPKGRAFGAKGPSPQHLARTDDSLSAARFFYCPKPTKAERNAGLEENNHPTVKPIALMRYLNKLVTPPDGIILDPFLGSGTTACAAILDDYGFIGIELESESFEIAKSRILYWKDHKQE